MNLKQKLVECRNSGKALSPCKYYNFETLNGVCLEVNHKLGADDIAAHPKFN